MPFEWNSMPAAGAVAARVFAVVVMAMVAMKLGDSLIARVFRRASGVKGASLDDKRAKTLSGILNSTVRYIIAIVAFLTVLELLGIDTKALLGGAAILGLAVGFGAQSLVKDIITGFFIIYERQYDVGDYIMVAGLSGEVEEIGLRTTRLRDWSGDVHVIPNGLVEKTTNKNRADSRALVEITISHQDDVGQAMAILEGVCQEVAKSAASLTQGPRVLGITRLDASGVVLLVWAKTKPLQQWGLERELRLRAKEALGQAGIEIPYPKMVILGPRENIPHENMPEKG